MLLVVNYHYIRDEIPKNGIYPVTSSFFKYQLGLIHKNGYEFVSLNQINEVIKKGGKYITRQILFNNI